jgi:glycosyltransferase involved in cell wall biosynthesis
VDHTFRRWSPEGEVAVFQELDVGLYPLHDTPWGRGKCGFKALQYLACAVPCVASPVGVLREIVRPGETGRHATDAEEWVAACEALLEDPAERCRLGGAGRALVERAFSVPVAVEILSGAVHRALAGA